MDLTIFDFEVKNEVFQNLKGPKEFDFCQFVNVDLKHFGDELGIWKENPIVRELCYQSEAYDIGEFLVNKVIGFGKDEKILIFGF